jgi:hypothetical protein
MLSKRASEKAKAAVANMLIALSSVAPSGLPL